VGHLYGVALYYGTCGFAEHMGGMVYSRPEGLYYWGYYVGMNMPWAVVPSGEYTPFLWDDVWMKANGGGVGSVALEECEGCQGGV
jgi:hypothetical protein